MSSPDSTKHGSAVKLKLPGSGSSHSSPPTETAEAAATDTNAANASPDATQDTQEQESGVMTSNDHDVKDVPTPAGVAEASASISAPEAATENASATTSAAADSGAAATAEITAVEAAAAHTHGARATEIALAKQTIASQNTSVRSIVARAAADMENWRRTIGAQQEAEVFTYWESWTGHMNCVTEINNALLSYIRAAAASAAVYASSMKAGADLLKPVSSEELMAEGNASPAALAALATGSAVKKTSSGFFSLSTASPSSSTAAAGRAISSFGVSADASSARHALTLSILTDNISQVHMQAAEHVAELANALSKDVCGDTDGPLGKKGDRTHVTAPDKKRTDPGEPCPPDLFSMGYWYKACAEDMVKAGTKLSESLAEVSVQVYEAYENLELHVTALLTGNAKSKFKGKDLWLSELRFRRTCRALLAVKQHFMSTMALLYERYRLMETGRTEVVANSLEKYSNLTAKVFERVSAKTITDAVKNLNTHADFFRVVQEDSRNRIQALHVRWRESEEVVAAETAKAAAMTVGQQAGEAEAAPSDDATEGRLRGYSSYGRQEAGATSPVAPKEEAPSNKSVHFSLDASPAVISPLCSPLVVRTGTLLRQMGMMRSWKPCLAVLTRDGNLHLFSTEDDDLASHPHFIVAIANWSASRGSRSVAAAVDKAIKHDGPDSKTHKPTPTPALPTELMALAASYSSNVSDLLGMENFDPVECAKKSAAPPSQTFVITPTTKLAFAPTIHADAFEIIDRTGFFGFTNKLALRTTSAEDCVDWVVTSNHVIDLVAHAHHVGEA